jgi:hypothetical protein
LNASTERIQQFQIPVADNFLSAQAKHRALRETSSFHTSANTIAYDLEVE